MRKGFTLIELLAVIVILAVIALIAIFAITRLMNNARFNTLTNTALAARNVANLYFTDNPDATNINFTEHRELLTFERDPWGERIEEIRATINNNREIKIAIELYSEQRWQRFNEISDKWMLKHDGERVVPYEEVEPPFSIKIITAHGTDFFPPGAVNSTDGWQTLTGNFSSITFHIGTWGYDSVNPVPPTRSLSFSSSGNPSVNPAGNQLLGVVFDDLPANISMISVDSYETKGLPGLSSRRVIVHEHTDW